MIVPFILLFFVLGWRAKNISRRYYVWIVIVAGFAVISLTDNQQKAANRLGNHVDFSAIALLGVWLYYAALILAGLLAGGWIGIRRRYAKLIKQNPVGEESGL